MSGTVSYSTTSSSQSEETDKKKNLFELTGVINDLAFEKGYTKFFRKHKLNESLFSQKRYDNICNNENAEEENNCNNDYYKFIKIILYIEKYIEGIIGSSIIFFILVIGFVISQQCIKQNDPGNFEINKYTIQNYFIIPIVLSILIFILFLSLLITDVRIRNNSDSKDIINHLKIDTADDSYNYTEYTNKKLSNNLKERFIFIICFIVIFSAILLVIPAGVISYIQNKTAEPVAHHTVPLEFPPN